jgi:hypothetical protein
MSRKIIIAIGAAGLILTAFNWTEAVARDGWVSHGSADWHRTVSRDADHNDNFGHDADRDHAHHGDDKDSSSHEDSGEKSSSFKDNRHKSEDHDGEWHKTSSDFHREWEAGGDTH